MLIVGARVSGTSAFCPSCQQPSRRVHSFYTRAPADLPLGGYPVQLQLSVRRFYCHHATCEKRTFTEQLPELLAFRARRTHRLLAAQRSVGIALGGEAVRTFVDFVRHQRPKELDTWLGVCAASSVKALRTFAAGIQQDYEAVRSALELSWSNAQTEGHVTRLKFIKRTMYGRAKFDLLRQRVLLAA